MAHPWIHWLEDLGQGDGDRVGRKCANLGELTRLGMRVPPGFAISVDAYGEYMALTGLADRIAGCFRALGGGLERSFVRQVEASRRVRELIRTTPLPAAIGDAIEQSYEALCARCRTPDVAVAVRSSGPSSMPGQMETRLAVRGGAAVKRRVVEVWESAFNTRAIAFRLERGLPVDRAPIGVAIMKMVDARSAGVVLTVDPLTGDADRVVIEGSWGLGESVASGELTPDQFVLTKGTGAIEKRVARKTRRVVSTGEGTATADVAPELQEAPCLADEEIRELARVAMALERHFGAPQDIEWVVDRAVPFPENVSCVQARPARCAPRRQGAETDYLVDQMTRLFSR